MNCKDLENALDQLVGGPMPAALREEAERHMAACPGCRDLVALARAEIEAGPIPGDVDIVAGVMGRTSGAACGAAADRLCSLADGTADAADAQLVSMHTDHCRPCDDLARTLAWLSRELPAIAEVRPDARFVDDVMAATARDGAGIGRRLRAMSDRLAGLVARPRFPIEAAYAGALVVWILFGAPFSPWRDVPSRALALTRVNPVEVVASSVRPASLGGRVWETTGGPVIEPVIDGVRTRARGAREASRSLGNHAAAMIDAAMEGDLESGAAHLRKLREDLGSLWEGLTRTPPPANEPARRQEA